MRRREFVASLGALGIPPALRRAHLGPLGLQLYTVRHLMERDVPGTLREVAETGYREVEFAGYFNVAPAQIRRILDQLHLAAPSAHVDFSLLESGWPATIEMAHAIGHRYLVVAWIPEERRRTLDDWRRIADLFNHAGETADAAGVQFAFHNHSYEFEPMEGRLPYDVLTESTDPHYVQLELDLYWITAGGQDPLAYFARYPGRFPMVHVKDMTRDKRMVDVGAGSINWRRIFQQRRRAGIRHLFVEHDEPPDPLASIRNSYRYLSRLSV